MKLRLILFEACGRSCCGCCNQDWDLAHLPVCSDYSPYELIMLTGGEPMLRPEVIRAAVAAIRAQTHALIYLYTDMGNGLDDYSAILRMVEMLDALMELLDGITITLHEPKDVLPFAVFACLAKNLAGKSLRLNVFREVGTTPRTLQGWKIKEDTQLPLAQG